MTNISVGLGALVRSRKFWTALISTVSIAFAVVFHLPDAVIAGVQLLALALIATWTVEDAVEKAAVAFAKNHK